MTLRSTSFAARVVAWQRRHGRHDLPWQGTRDPYRIWVAEIMLQQTQVASVIAYFERFVTRFPDVSSLAAAPVDEVMRHWSGLGYYARARNLHRAARIVVDELAGHFPDRAADIEALPGVGRSTAAAIAAFAAGERVAILDGNVKRVLARHFGVAGATDAAPVLAKLWAISQSLLPETNLESYTQGLMDLGATLCTRSRPACESCPVRGTCIALRDGRIAQLPGRKTLRPLSIRQVAMLVVVSGGEVLLEKRPPTGVWGGLWSLPEAPVDADPAASLRSAYGLRAVQVEAVTPFRHAFTHFTLDIKPWLMRIRTRGSPQAKAAGMWLPLQETNDAALPAPVKRLLARLASDAPSPGDAVCARSGAGSRGVPRHR